MSAKANRDLIEFLDFFRHIWEELHALRTVQTSQLLDCDAKMQKARKEARIQAQELFEPLVNAVERNRPVLPLLEHFVQRAKQKVGY